MAEPKNMLAAIHASMADRTGRTLDEWVTLVEQQADLDPLDQKAVRAFLRDQHGVKQNSQWAIAIAVAERAGWSMPTWEQYADELYTGTKASLRALHDAVVEIAEGMGPDADAQGRAGHTPVARKTQFLAVGPGPRGTLRVGFRFRKDAPDDPRLEPAKGFAQATHWVHLEPSDEPAQEAHSLHDLIRVAYDQNG